MLINPFIRQQWTQQLICTPKNIDYDDDYDGDIIIIIIIIIIVVVVVVIIIIIISFMQGTYIPETNYIPREHSVAAILLLLFMVLI